jgi:hypothetical protein
VKETSGNLQGFKEARERPPCSTELLLGRRLGSFALPALSPLSPLDILQVVKYTSCRLSRRSRHLKTELVSLQRGLGLR